MGPRKTTTTVHDVHDVVPGQSHAGTNEAEEESPRTREFCESGYVSMSVVRGT